MLEKDSLTQILPSGQIKTNSYNNWTVESVTLQDVLKGQFTQKSNLCRWKEK